MLTPKTFQPLLTGPSERVPALCPDEEEGLHRVMRAYRGEPYCLVSKWVIVELDAEQILIDELSRDGLQPYVLFARRVIYDSRGRFSRENYVLTSPLKQLNRCFFIPQNTVYVLIGVGKQQKCSIYSSARKDSLLATSLPREERSSTHSQQHFKNPLRNIK